jgi:hypothetical protein
MRLKQYINESEFFSSDNWNKLHTNLDKKCKPFIKELKNARYLLMRGVQDSKVPQFITIRQVRKDRRPRVINSELHDMLGKVSNEKFGWNTRTQGLFTTKSRQNASVWGKSIIVFPIGNFKYVWNNDVSDLYEKYDEWELHDSNEGIFNVYIKPEISEYKTTNLNEYLKQPDTGISECIINCDKYYSINIEWYETLLKYYS